MTVVFSRAARTDLIDIGLYIAQDNQARALSFVDELEAKCLRLAKHTDIGVARSELGEGLRMVAHGHYLVFYRQRDEALRIERVMHGARDISDDDF